VTGTLDDLPPAPGSLDVASLWHVLEHIPDPLASLTRLRADLRPAGHVFVEVPNAESVAARRAGAGWHAAEVVHHVSQFGPRSLRALVERAGFHVLDLHTFPFTGYYHPLRRLRVRDWPGYAALARDVRANPLGRHPWRHELLRLAARA
jgi:2-polyprenyl-3-methyl-5-hydroxy-6-metoxy-1,4-benzoquinol methylase